MRVMFVAGGTGGHINPAVAVATEIKRLNPSAEILFVGTEGRMETQIVPKAGFEIKTVKMNGFSRKKSISGIIENVKTIMLTLKASSDSKVSLSGGTERNNRSCFKNSGKNGYKNCYPRAKCFPGSC